MPLFNDKDDLQGRPWLSLLIDVVRGSFIPYKSLIFLVFLLLKVII